MYWFWCSVVFCPVGWWGLEAGKESQSQKTERASVNLTWLKKVPTVCRATRQSRGGLRCLSVMMEIQSKPFIPHLTVALTSPSCSKSSWKFSLCLFIYLFSFFFFFCWLQLVILKLSAGCVKCGRPPLSANTHYKACIPIIWKQHIHN